MKETQYYEWQIKIISFSKQLPLTSQLNSLFPGVNLTIQQAVDFRQVSEHNLFKSSLINMSAYLTMTEGRKWDREVNSKGAVGLAQANRIALLDSKNYNKSILLCEDDCYINKPVQFVNEINQLLYNTSSFDLAVFGVKLLEESDSHLDPVAFMPDGWYYLDENSHFWFTHCVLYTPEGRKKVGEHLKNEKLEMQIDGLYSYMNKLKLIKVIVQVTNLSAIQTNHASSIQTDHCPICEMKPNIPRRQGIVTNTTTNTNPVIINSNVLNNGGVNMLIGILILIIVIVCWKIKINK